MIQTTLRLPEALYRRLKDVAKQQGKNFKESKKEQLVMRRMRNA